MIRHEKFRMFTHADETPLGQLYRLTPGKIVFPYEKQKAEEFYIPCGILPPPIRAPAISGLCARLRLADQLGGFAAEFDDRQVALDRLFIHPGRHRVGPRVGDSGTFAPYLSQDVCGKDTAAGRSAPHVRPPLMIPLVPVMTP
ncbi:MAG: hypothetical protein ABIF71_08860 [Planctomycetota bacterium]